MPMLRIKFSGLCTFIFDRPLKGKGGAAAPAEATVLLQRLTRARKLQSNLGAEPEILDQHFPLLEFDLADYDTPGSSRRPDVHCHPDPDGRMTQGTCLLVGEDLTILPDGRRLERHALELSSDPPKSPDRLTKQDRDSLYWMATLEDVFPGKAAILDEILNLPPASNQPILARVMLTEGRLRTLEVTDAPCIIVPPVDGPDFSQQVATSFEFAVPFCNSVTIRSSALRNGKTTVGDMIFRPVGGSDVQLEIMNMEINRLVGLDPANGPRAEADFGVYADLLKERPDRIPFLRQTIAGDPASAPHSTCVPAGG